MIQKTEKKPAGGGGLYETGKTWYDDGRQYAPGGERNAYEEESMNE